MVELSVADGTPSAIVIPYTMLTSLLIFIHLLALIVATRILPELEAFINNPELSVPQPIAQGHYWPVQFVWYLSNIVGVLLFLVQLVLVAYVKFYPQNILQADRMHVGTATLVVVCSLSFVSIPFIAIFFRSLSKQKTQYHEQKLERARVFLEYINQTSFTVTNI